MTGSADRPVSWKRVTVFISSTFNDMHAERDYLVKQVFPDLADWCERRRLRLVDVDLRWGITESDATNNKNVVYACLNRIDDCRPFFVCFVGQRRGWVPSVDHIDERTLKAFPGIEPAIGKASVTELEIMHAVIKPLCGGRMLDSSRLQDYYLPAKYAFFYLRDLSYLNEMPSTPLQLRDTYTNSGSDDPVRDEDALAQWRNVIIQECGRSVHTYRAQWDASLHSPELALPLRCSSTTPSNQNQWRHNWQQADVPIGDDGLSVVDRLLADAHNNRLTAGRLTNFFCSGGTLAETILEDLKKSIAARYPECVEKESNPGSLQRELDQQEQFLHTNTYGFVRREGDFDELDNYVRGQSKQLLVLTAGSGIGKSVLLSNWIERWRTDDTRSASADVIFRFIGQSDNSGSLTWLLRSILDELRTVYSKLPLTIKAKDPSGVERDVPLEIPQKTDQLVLFWREWITKIQKDRPTIIVIDGINQLETGLTRLDWLPQSDLSDGLKLIVSVRRDTAGAKDLFTRWQSPECSKHIKICEVVPFTEPRHKRALIAAYLSEYLKELDEALVEMLVGESGGDNPLYLKVVLSELRIFGSFGNLANKLRNDFGTSPTSAFRAALRRLMADSISGALKTDVVAPIVFGAMGCSRGGLTIQELTDIVYRSIIQSTSSKLTRRAAEEAVLVILRQFRPYLSRRNGIYDFYYESLKVAAAEAFFTTAEHAGEHIPTADTQNPETAARPAEAWHGIIADYYLTQPDSNVRRLRALPHHLIVSGRWEDLVGNRETPGILVNLKFIHASCAVGLIYELIHCFNETLARCPTPSATLRDFSNFVSHFAQQLHRYPDDTIMLAYNYAESGPVNEAARKHVDGESVPWLRRVQRPSRPHRPACLRVISLGSNKRICVSPDGHKLHAVGSGPQYGKYELETGESAGFEETRMDSLSACLSLSPDASRAVFGSRYASLGEETLFVWELSATRQINRLLGYPRKISCACFYPDREGLVSAGVDGSVLLWDIARGNCIGILDGHKREVTSVCVPLGTGLIVSASDDGIIRVWEEKTGTCLHVLQGHDSGSVKVCAYPYGHRVVSVGADGAIRVWALDKGVCLHGYQDKELSFSCVSVSPDGRYLAVGGDINSAGGSLNWHKGDVHIWELGTWKKIRTFQGHTRAVTCLSWSPVGRQIVSASDDGTARVWDLDTDDSSGATVQHKGAITDISIRPGGRYAISAATDQTLRLWELETGVCLRVFEGHKGGVEVVCFCRDGQSAIAGDDHLTVLQWEIPSGGHWKLWEVGRTPKKSRSACLDGRHYIAPDDKGCVWVHDLKTGVAVHQLNGHRRGISSLAVSVDGCLVVSADYEDTLRVWDLRTGACIAAYHATAPVTAAAISSTGEQIVCGSGDGQIHFLSLVNAPPQGSAILTVPRFDKTVPFLQRVLNGLGRFWVRCPSCGRNLRPKRVVIKRLHALDRLVYTAKKTESLGMRGSRDYEIELEDGSTIRMEKELPCRRLPADAGMHPDLTCTCPKCARPLRYNPFFGEQSKDEEIEARVMNLKHLGFGLLVSLIPLSLALLSCWMISGNLVARLGGILLLSISIPLLLVTTLSVQSRGGKLLSVAVPLILTYLEYKLVITSFWGAMIGIPLVALSVLIIVFLVLMALGYVSQAKCMNCGTSMFAWGWTVAMCRKCRGFR